ncbi:MAG: PKD domain-containing protein [Candidatus Parvarchaeota archaeon]
MDSSDMLMYGGIALLVVGIGAYLYETIGKGSGGKNITNNQLAPSLSSSVSGLNVTLTVSYSTSNPSITPTFIAIDWGDGSTPAMPSSVGTFTHAYSSPGTYTITVTFTYPSILVPNSASSSGTTPFQSSVTVTVGSGTSGGGGSGGLVSPTLQTSISNYTVYLTVTNSATNVQTTVAWGDGSSTQVTSANYQHTYQKAGTYTITVTESSIASSGLAQSGSVLGSWLGVSSGPTVSATTTVTVPGGSSQSQQTLFAPTLTTSVSGNTVYMSVDTSKSTAQISQVSVNWGDGNTSNSGSAATNFVHSYSNPGTYTITVTISDSSGDSAFSTANVTISGSGSSSVSSSNSLGTYSNPYLFDNGYVNQGYYEFTQAEFSKLLTIPASGVTLNPMWIGTQLSYNAIKSWLSYTVSTSGSGSTGAGSSTTINPISPRISINPTTIAESNGSSITITGSGFTPNGKGYVFSGTSSVGGIEISGFTADSSGNFSVNSAYEFSQTQVSNLANAIQDAPGNFIDITAYDYSSGKYSNTVVLYFS